MNKIKLVFIVCAFLLVSGCVQNEKIENNAEKNTYTNEEYKKLEQLAKDISREIKLSQYKSKIEAQKVNYLLEKEKKDKNNNSK